MARATASQTQSSPAPAGLALHSKSHQLAEYLRACLREGRLVAPLPGMRLWSRQLGVSRRTLHTTLRELQREGWLTVARRGIRLNPSMAAQPHRGTRAPPLVRVLLYAAYGRQNYNYLETFGTLQERLRLRGIEMKGETCSPARLREIARVPGSARELLVLASLPSVFQRLFADTGRPAVVLGEGAPGLTLPYVNVDQTGAVRHATFRLLQQGCTHLGLVHVKVEAAGIRSSLAAFAAACASWPRQPVTIRLFATALDQASLMATVRRLALGTRGRAGFIVVAPVPVSMVVTALLQHGIAVPRQAAVVALFHPTESIRLYPPPAHYPSPTAAVVRQLTEAAAQFFATGRLPPIAKTIAVEPAPAG